MKRKFEDNEQPADDEPIYIDLWNCIIDFCDFNTLITLFRTSKLTNELTSPYVSTKNVDRFIKYYFRDRACLISYKVETPLFIENQHKWVIANKNNYTKRFHFDREDYDKKNGYLDDIKNMNALFWLIRVAHTLKVDDNNWHKVNVEIWKVSKYPFAEPKLKVVDTIQFFEKWIPFCYAGRHEAGNIFIKNGCIEIEKTDNSCGVCKKRFEPFPDNMLDYIIRNFGSIEKANELQRIGLIDIDVMDRGIIQKCHICRDCKELECVKIKFKK